MRPSRAQSDQAAQLECSRRSREGSHTSDTPGCVSATAACRTTRRDAVTSAGTIQDRAAAAEGAQAEADQQAQQYRAGEDQHRNGASATA